MASGKGVALATIFALSCILRADADDLDTSPPPGIAPTSMTVARLAAATREATGRPTHVVTTRREQWKISFGALTGTDTYVQSGGNYRLDETLGPNSTASGVFASVPWQINANGEVAVGSHLHRADEVDATALYHSGAGVALIGRVSSPVDAYVVRIDPPGGRLEYRFYDAKTYLLDRIEEIRDAKRVTITFDDYRRTNGVSEPWHIHTTDGFATNDGDRTLLSLQVGVPVAASEVAIPNDRRVLISPAALPAKIPATLSGDAFVIPVQIGQYVVNCVLDSGADGIVIDTAVINALGLKSYGRVTSETAGTYVESDVVIPAMKIGPLTLNDVHARSLPFTQWTDNGKPIAGLLGFDVLRDGIWHLDYQHGEVEAIPEAGFTPPAGARTLAATFDDDVPTIALSIDGLKGPAFVFDTGADRSAIFSRYAGEHPAEFRDLGLGQAMSDAFPFINEFAGVGGSVDYHPIEIGPLVVGDFTFPKWLFEVTQNDASFEFEDYDGIIGQDLLRNFDVYLDYQHSKIYLVPNDRFRARWGD